MKKEIITKLDPKSPVSEVFRTLRTNIQYINRGEGAQTILVTSTTQGEGKSWIVANLAVTFAQAEKSVIIIDADMRRPRQNSLFSTEMFPGLSNYLSGINPNGQAKDIKIKDCVKNTEIENLYVIPAGNIPPNPSELLSNEKLLKMLTDLKKIFDVIIFDGAPCLLVTDATLVSRAVDSTILVACQGKTKIDDLKEAKRRIEHVGGKIAGVILNRVKVSGKSYENRYYYSSNNELPVSKVSYKVESSPKRLIKDEGPTKHEEKQNHTKLQNNTNKPIQSKIEINIDKDSENSEKIKNILDQINSYNEGKY